MAQGLLRQGSRSQRGASAGTLCGGMATIGRQELVEALTRLGELAAAQAKKVDLLLVGGGVMVLVFGTRQSTRDLDVVILPPSDAAAVRALAATVADERGWPSDWLNDAAKGFMVGLSRGPVIFSAPGVEVFRATFEQLLAMKLCAWRDDVDIADARRLLEELPGSYNDVWRRVEPYLQLGREMKAKYAFDDLWEDLHGAT